jgi:hypothetical protein
VRTYPSTISDRGANIVSGRPSVPALFTTLPSAIVVIAVLVVAVSATVVAVFSLGSEDLFRYAQSSALGLNAPVVTPASMESALARVPAPVAPSKRTPAVLTNCTPRGGGPLRNPWTCVIRYRSGVTAHYLIQINSDGSFNGVGTGTISGCCVKLPDYG